MALNKQPPTPPHPPSPPSHNMSIVLSTWKANNTISPPYCLGLLGTSYPATVLLYDGLPRPAGYKLCHPYMPWQRPVCCQGLIDTSCLTPIHLHGMLCVGRAYWVRVVLSLATFMAWWSGGRFKNAYELLNLRALKFSPMNKIHIFQCMGKIFCVEFQRYSLKFHTKCLSHTLKDMTIIVHWNFQIGANVFTCWRYSISQIRVFHHLHPGIPQQFQKASV